MSFQAVAWAIEQRVGDAILKNLLIAICHHADRVTWNCWPSQELLAYETEVSKRTIQRKLEELEEKGFIFIEKQRAADGKQANSKITVAGGQPVTLSPPVDRIGLSGGQNPGAPVDTTSPPIKKQSEQVEQSLFAEVPKEKKPAGYTEEFENDIWKPYPRKLNCSKVEAYKKYQKLPDADKEQLRRAIPAFAAQMRGKEEQYIPHLATFINQRRFETVAATAIAGQSDQVAFDRKSWEMTAKIYENSNNWRREWGPEPGHPRCQMPADLQRKFVNSGLTQH